MVAAKTAEVRELLLFRRFPAGTKVVVECESEDKRNEHVIVRVWKEPAKQKR